MNFFDRINAWMDRSEVSWVTLLTKFLPIMVPLIPAIQTKNHVVSVLQYDTWQGWVAAAIVEFFGYASMYKMMQFAFKKAGFWMVTFAIVIYLFYLGVIIAFNVLPEIKAGKEPYIIWMNSLFALLSVPASALTAISAIHTERSETERAERERLNAERKAERERLRAEREQRKAAEQANALTNEQTRTNRQTNEQPRRTNTPVPQPTNEHPFQIPNTERPNTERTQRIEQAARTLEAELNRQPSVREIQQRLRSEDGTDTGWSTSTISGALKK